MLIKFLQYDGGIEAGYLNDLLYDLEGLFTLVDIIVSEGNKKLNEQKYPEANRIHVNHAVLYFF